jgi:hypothetical protein
MFDFSEMFKAMREGEERAKRAAVKAMDDYGEHVLGDAQQLAPVGGGTHSPRDPDPGRLVGSATAEPAVLEGTKVTKVIGFNTEYAAVQHEDLDFGHDQGQAKYLSAAITANAPKFEAFVGKRIQDALEK